MTKMSKKLNLSRIVIADYLADNLSVLGISGQGWVKLKMFCAPKIKIENFLLEVKHYNFADL